MVSGGGGGEGVETIFTINAFCSKGVINPRPNFQVNLKASN